MHSSSFLSDALILFGSAIIVAMALRAIRIPSIIGFLLAGVAIGPSGWGLIAPESSAGFAELGIVLLLFTVGLELSPRHLLQTGSRLVWATMLQFAFVGGLSAAALLLAGATSVGPLMVASIAVSLSSTAIVLKLLHDRGESESSVGIITTGVLLLQDVAVIVVMLLISAMHGAGESPASMLMREAAALAGLVLVVVLARYALPRFLQTIAKHGGRELLTLFAVLMACGGAWAAAAVGWSAGLGACIAGLLLADADQRHQLVAEITPFRDVFNALFFISLGMLVDLDVVVAQLPLLLAAVGATIVLKSAATALAVRLAGWPLRIAIITGISLCTVSEFAYVLADQAAELGYFSASALTLMTAYTVGTMLIGALLFPAAAPLADRLFTRRAVADLPAPSPDSESFRHHVIIVGYGVTGHNLAHVLRATRIPYCVVEMNPTFVRKARRDGAPTIVGDATRMSILQHAGIGKAHALVLAINDPRAVERIIAQVSALYPRLFTLVRVRFVQNIEPLYAKGAKLVIPEDFETSIEIAAHLLKEFRVPGNIINAQLASLRAGGYGLMRGKPADRVMTLDLIKILEQAITETFYLSEGSTACGQTLQELDLRAQTGCSVIAVVRQGKPNTNPGADFQLAAGDVLVLVGAHEQLDSARLLLGKED